MLNIDGHTLAFSAVIGVIWFCLTLALARRDPWRTQLKTATFIGLFFFVSSVAAIQYLPSDTPCLEQTKDVRC